MFILLALDSTRAGELSKSPLTGIDTNIEKPKEEKGLHLPPQEPDAFGRIQNTDSPFQEIIPEPHLRFLDISLRTELKNQGFDNHEINEILNNPESLQRLKLLDEELAKLHAQGIIRDQEAQELERVYIAMGSTSPILALRHLMNLLGALKTAAAIQLAGSAISSTASYAAEWVKKQAEKHPELAQELQDVLSSSPSGGANHDCQVSFESSKCPSFLSAINSRFIPHLDFEYSDPDTDNVNNDEYSYFEEDTCEELCIAEQGADEAIVEATGAAHEALYDSDIIHENYKKEQSKLQEKKLNESINQLNQDNALVKAKKQNYVKDQTLYEVKNEKNPKKQMTLRGKIRELTLEQKTQNGGQINFVA